MRTAHLACLILFLAARPNTALADDPAPKRYAIIVGYNGASRPGVKPLAYADDDAFRWAELLRMATDGVTLLVEPDSDTLARLRPQDLDFRAPTLSNLAAAFEAYNEPGATILYVHASHGGQDDETRGGLVYVMLRGSNGGGERLFQRDVRRIMVDRLAPGARLDIILDTCYAYHFVVPRRDGDELDDLDTRLAAAAVAEDLSLQRNVGFIAATVGFQEIAESSVLNGSFFSHIVRTGLLGAADADGTGRIDYGEMASYLRQHERIPKANSAEEFRVALHAPDDNPGRVLVQWDRPAGRSAILQFGRGVGGRARVHAADHGAYASFGKHSDHLVRLRVVPGRRYTVVPGDGEPPRAFVARPGDTVDAAALPDVVLPDATMRGSERMLEHIEYRGLLHCKTHEGFALASHWPFAGCPDEWGPLPGPSQVTVTATYRLADAPFTNSDFVHGSDIAVAYALWPYLHVQMLGRVEATAGAATPSRPEVLGGALGVGVTVPLWPFAQGSLDAGIVGGWAPLRVRHADGRVERMLADSFFQAEVALRVGTPLVQARVGGGIEVDVRDVGEGGLGADPRWFVSAGVTVRIP